MVLVSVYCIIRSAARIKKIASFNTWFLVNQFQTFEQIIVHFEKEITNATYVGIMGGGRAPPPARPGGGGGPRPGAAGAALGG